MKTWFLILLELLSVFTWAEMDLQKFCSDKGLNEVFVHPHDCRGYISCSANPTVQYCEKGFHFDINGLVCNYPEKVNCQISPRQVEEENDLLNPALTSLAAFDIMTGQLVNPLLNYNPINVVCRHFGAYFLPNPKKCRSYYLCAYGHMHEHVCGPHTLWDYQLQQCVLSHQAVCYQSTQEEEKELVNLALENVTMVCYPVKANPLVTGTVQLTSTEYVTTATPETITTAATIITTTTPIPTTPPLTTSDDTTLIPTTSKKPTFPNPYNIKCPVKRQSYVPHPEDCSKYFMCIMGIPVMTSCPKGLLWDSKNSYCDIAENVICFPEKFTNK